MRFVRMIISAVIISAALQIHAGAVDHNIGRYGGVFCTLHEQFVEYLRSQSSSNKLKPDDFYSCFRINPNTKIDLQSQVTFDGVQTGQGIVTSPEGALVEGYFVSVIDLFADIAPHDNSSARSFKRVSPEDVRNSPAKWARRDIEFSAVQVYWVDDDDVRFLTNAFLTVFAAAVRGEARLLSRLKSGCETAHEASGRACRVTIRFSYSQHGEDSPNGFLKRTVIQTDDIEVIQPRR